MSKAQTQYMFTRVPLDKGGSNTFTAPSPEWSFARFELSPASHFHERGDYMALEAVVLWRRKP